MSDTVKIDSLAAAIVDEISKYSEEVENKMQKVVDEVTKEAYLDLRTNPSVPQRTGEYARGFYIKKTSWKTKYKSNIIGNKKYQLTHLLEKGHDIVRNSLGKKKVYGKTKAYPHWENAQKIADSLPERLKKELEQ